MQYELLLYNGILVVSEFMETLLKEFFEPQLSRPSINWIDDALANGSQMIPEVFLHIALSFFVILRPFG